MLDISAKDTIAGLRDRAILSGGLQVGLRRAEIAALKGRRFAPAPRLRFIARVPQGRPARRAGN
jgi:hypothetical protein